MVQKALSAKSLTHAQGATILTGWIKVLPLFLIVIPGMISRVLYPNEVGCVNPETVRTYLIHIINHQKRNKSLHIPLNKELLYSFLIVHGDLSESGELFQYSFSSLGSRSDAGRSSRNHDLCYVGSIDV